MLTLTDQSEGTTVLGITNRSNQGNESSKVSILYNA